jgi:hypothetical protein
MKKKLSLDYNLEFKTRPYSFPETRFMFLDTSDSMREAINEKGIGNTSFIPWGVNSRYHYSLLTWYCFLEFLKTKQLLTRTNISLVNFSNETILGNGLYESKRIALKPQFGLTYIDEETLKKVFEGREKLIFTVSDGGIQNWHSIRESFIQNSSKHFYFHMQMGGENQTSRDLKANGLNVYYIEKAEDLWKQVIDLSEKIYSRIHPKQTKN